MNDRQSSMHKHVWRLIFIPILTVIVLVGVSLGWVILSQLNDHLHTRGKVYAEQTAKLLYPAIAAQNFHEAQELMRIANEEFFLRAIHVQVTHPPLQLHQGPSFLLNDEQAAQYESLSAEKILAPQLSENYQTLRFSHPLRHHLSHTPIGWVEVEIISSPYQLMSTQALGIIFLVVMAGLIIASGLAVSLHNQIVQPLAHIKTMVGEMATGKLGLRIGPQKNTEFQAVVDSINIMADSLSRAQHNMQQHIDMAVSELHETLETIEVQNVQLDIARKEALEASRIKSEFLANTSHEIRTPLNGILGFANLLVKSDINPKQRDYVDTIRDSAQHLLTVINGILDFSKIEAGKLTLEYAPLAIQGCVDEVFHLLAPAADEKNIQLINYVDAKIPENLLGDAMRLKQVLTNLVNNAIKYSPCGNVIVSLECLDKTETAITIKAKITDEGMGLTQAAKDTLFAPFVQADSANNRQYDGTGLGLAICKGLVERMQGQIGVDSEPEKGATFWFTATFGIDKHQPNYHLASSLESVKILICGQESPSRAQLASISANHLAQVHFIDTIHDCFAALRTALNNGSPFKILMLDLAPDERKIPPSLLSNFSEQINLEFNCHTLVCCSPTQQHIYTANTRYPAVSFINKPLYQDQFFTAIARKLNLPAEGESRAQAHAQQTRVLLVDDNQANLHLASELLKGLGAQVTSANSGPEAIELFKQAPVDLVFMDIQMPGMDGIEATKLMREYERDNAQKRTPIIALTAHTLSDNKTELLIAGMDDCLSKPINENQLLHTLNRWTQAAPRGLATPATSPLPASSTADSLSVMTSPATAQLSSGFIKTPDNNLSEFYPQMPEPTPPLPEELSVLQKKPQINAAPAQNTSPVNEMAIENEDELAPIDLRLGLQLANRKPALAADMIEALINELPQQLERLIQAHDGKHWESFSFEVHRLYGSSCYCGVPTLKAISGTLDRLCQQQQFNALDEGFADLQDEIQGIMQWQKNRDLRALIAEIA